MKPETRQRAAMEALKHFKDHTEVEDYDQALVPLPTAQVAGAGTVRLSALSAKPIRWIWPGHIPYGALTLMIGDPGLGKSQLTLDLAARITKGMPWPDDAEAEVGNVALLSSEDSIERTILPRLTASGADLDRITAIGDITVAGKPRMFNLKSDLGILEDLVEKQYLDMVVIDPLNGFLGDTNSWKESEVRAVLGPLCALAERHDVALLGVVHLNKDNTRSAIHRVLGSVAFAAVTRAMFAVAPHPAYPKMRYFVSVKQNYTAPPPTLGFTCKEGGGVAWDGLTYPGITADSLLSVSGAPEEKAERRNAREWLRQTLENGPVKTVDLVKLADESAVSRGMLQKAKYDLKVMSQRHHQPGKLGGGFWEWRLP